ncbi:MAG: WbuC family cupin fold metalloprotein [Paludibacterium sp.]|uniref:WbuC family cupin fold metalloprotein n=1 Tax=Paludibacterium sp. TaxID=1917523 RepID=UPI0025FEC248|nr:WbuC family cupin fold metalloprotein [Paludibacterium sp.]MBV8047438.1 WbuC family cupin fold metalloprotein [Paludibacterium sp.]MBV8649217.1 WbuC family cupin fold metalloprotein [Paludibacterium sp.]
MKSLKRADLTALSAKAAAAPRLRAHWNGHEALSDPIQRLAIAMEPGTYVRPHRHPHTFEMLLPLSGAFDLIQFDEHGTVTARHRLGRDGLAVCEQQPGSWHSVIALDPGSVIFEVKHGPYAPLAADNLASWSPAEGEPAVPAMLEFLAHAVVGDRFNG